MKRFFVCVLCTILVLCFSAGSVLTQNRTSNSIQGFIFDANRLPVSDVYVELLNDTYSTLKRIKTDGSGRFYFGGLSEGNFKVKVLPYGTNYLEEVQDAEIINFNAGNSYTTDIVYLDFYLKLDKRKVNIDSSGTVGAVFVQDIPSQAKALYSKGVSQFERPADVDLGFESLKKALEIFPEYYDALNRISFEYVRRDKFYESLPHLVKAVRVNQRSFSCYFMLGTVAYNLKQYKEAMEAFRVTTVLSPQSASAQVKYGMVLRISGDYINAEKVLLKAVSLSNDFPSAEAHWQLALMYEKLGRFSEAASNLEKYIKIQPDAENKKQIKTLINSMKTKADTKKPFQST
ncbi:MAG: tetratricopeptide repeat protein [Saprospiraceae bacterium]|nr:tetratricopeptide repeat protein [Pyrinomonadaceae bacterium]